jgi:hypothetical protein
MWEHHVHETFRHHKSAESTKRQRDLVLALGSGGWIEVARLNQLTPQLAIAYVRKTPRTLQRDLQDIMATGLVERDKGRIRAKREVILAFLPARAAATASALK